MNQYERKKLHTKKEIENAFMMLLNEKNFFNITVSEICEKANISRYTFYFHFSDKEELITDIENDLLSQIEAITSSLRTCCVESALTYNDDVSVILKNLLHFIQSNKYYFLPFFSPYNEFKFKNRFKKLFKEVLLHSLNANNQSYGENQEYVLVYYSSGLTDTIYHWLIHDDKTPEELVDFYVKMGLVNPFLEQKRF